MGAYWLRRLITPHGDWKHPEYKDYPPPYSVLITPHGDWKLDTSMAPYNTLMSHYPSWGLETSTAGNGVEKPQILITPHGDWKRSSEPHSPASSINSLPLMGIGNDRRSPILRPARSTHYPSWGLETWTVVLDMPDGSSSLPLMGIGNRPGALWGLDAFKLITPHGDWKPQDAVLPDEWDRISLPLMGIGNPFAFAATSSVCVSLPLMGIGNFKHASLNLLQSVLITPHGDWKRPDRCGRSPA